MAQEHLITRNEDLAWAAGFYDGEGSTTLAKKGSHRYPRCTITQKHIEVLEKFQRIMGCGSITYRKATADHNEIHNWQARNNAETKMVIALMWPWLGSEKRNQAQIALDTSTWHNGMKDKLLCKDPTHEVIARSNGGRRCKTCQVILQDGYRRKRKLIQFASRKALGYSNPRMYGYR